ncbi:WD40-repeat-containing domain [Pseudocohnilembus persalinus]|uniref:Katanin p80 WD40 repeat-containing subunit B1 homolog n=1 Tax=Pseudocohnilembus persalinus TaxID=266149 RepID=A0A0V0QXL0_PSEPJ|nr:WD40-repeat-containing domain [Pseudocohnilembus persalinus]|eukprot:KRX07123.1 WD40-repeat-containing domain [Pseudocohnilembus persalinus]
MKRRNTKIHEFNVGLGTKVLCAKFGNQSKSVLVSGDDKNNVNLWKISKELPLMSLNNGPSLANAQVDVTSVLFNYSDTEIYSGSNRGTINVWDINNQKQSMTLKGHTVAINALSIFPMDEAQNLLVSGSYDTNVKVWDQRTKSAISTFKGHQMQINSLACSPDGRMIVSGSSDGTIKLWDLNAGKLIYTFMLHDSPVNTVKFNPQDMALASGASDKTVKYWDLETFQIISSTKPDTTPIQQILFSDDGKVLFSAANESLKVWNLEKDGLQLDNVESQWRQIQDMTISDVDDMILGLSATSSQFSLWACPLKLINMSEERQQKQYIYSRQDNKNQQMMDQQKLQQNQMYQNNLIKQGSYAQQYKQKLGGNENIQQNMQEIMANIQQVNNQMQNLDQQKQMININNNQQQQQNVEYQYQQQLQKQSEELQQKLKEQEEQLRQSQRMLEEQLLQQKISIQNQGQNDDNLGIPETNTVHIEPKQQVFYKKEIDRNNDKYRNNNDYNGGGLMEKERPEPDFDYDRKQEPEKDFNEQEEEKNLDQQQQMRFSMLQEEYRVNSTSKQKRANQNEINNQEDIIEEDLPEEAELERQNSQKKNQYIKTPQKTNPQINPTQYQQQNLPQQQQEYQQQVNVDNNNNNNIQQSNIMDQSSLTIMDGQFNMSSIYQQQDQDKYQQFDIIGDTLKEHQKFTHILQARINYMQPILHWWNNGNIKSALHAINQLTDSQLLMDALNMSLSLNKLQYLNIENVCILVSKAKILIESKYSPHIKCGLNFTSQILIKYKDEIINVKSFALMGKVDLAREERIKVYDKLLNELQRIYQLPRLKKIADKGSKDLGQMGKKLQNDLYNLFTKIDQVSNK